MISLAANTNISGGVAGGVLIGAASTWLMYKENQIMGVSGISATALAPETQEKNGRDARGYWTWSFIAGMLSTGTVLVLVQPEVFGTTTSPAAVLSPAGAAVAGLLTGFGTRMGSGCTSGHGICGLPRRSLRSLAAVLTFMTSGAVTTYVISHYQDALSLLFSSSGCSEVAGGFSNANNASQALRPLLYVLGGTFVASRLVRSRNKVTALQEHGSDLPGKTRNEPSFSSHLTSFLVGAVFSIGLAVGGMTDPSRVSGFLHFTAESGWDATLMGVMGGGVLVNLFTFEFMRSSDHGAACPTFKFDGHSKNLNIDRNLLLGSTLFGCGWGLSGVCPGPALTSLPGALTSGLGNGAMALYTPFMLLGMAVHKYV